MIDDQYNERSAEWSNDLLVDIPTQIGRYHIDRVIGSGGFGTVYCGDDPILKRKVAIKLSRNKSGDTELGDRLLREGRAAARLSHPNIVPIYETGTDGDHFYLVSEYCAGQTLKQWLAGCKEIPSPSLAVSIVTQLAEALHHAHQCRLLHRDVTPNNIILAQSPQKNAADPFVPRLTDFGLVHELDTQVQQESSIAGTLDYMPPEQMLVGFADVSEASDLYSLGTIFYQLLTLQLPYGTKDKQRNADVRAYQDCVSPRRFVPSLDRDLEAICLKLLQRAPSKRYQSAASLLRDLSQWKHGLPVSVRQRSIVERTARLVAEAPVLAASLLTLFAVLVGSTITLAALNRQVNDKSEQLEHALVRNEEQRVHAERLARNNELIARLASTERDKAIASQKLAIRQAFLADFQDALSHWNAHRPAFAKQQIQDIVAYDDGTYASRFDVQLVHSFVTNGISTLFDGEQDFQSLAFDEASGYFAAGRATGETRIWRVGDVTHAQIFQHSQASAITAVSLAHDLNLIAIGLIDKASGLSFAELRNLQTWELVTSSEPRSDAIEHVQIAPDGKQLAIMSGRSLSLLDRRGKKFAVEKELSLRNRGYRLASTDRDGSFLVNTDAAEVSRFCWQHGDVLPRTKTHSMASHFVISHDGRWLAYLVPNDSTVYFRCLDENVEAIVPLDLQDVPATSLAFGPNDELLACGTSNGALAVYDIRALHSLESTDWPDFTPTFARILPSTTIANSLVHTLVMPTEENVVCLTEDGSIISADFRKHSLAAAIHELPLRSAIANRVDWSNIPHPILNKSALIASLPPTAEYLVYSVQDRQLFSAPLPLEASEDLKAFGPEIPQGIELTAYEFCTRTGLLVIGTNDGRIYVSSGGEFREIAVDGTKRASIVDIQMSNDGKTLAVGTQANQILMWPIDELALPPRMMEVSGRLKNIRFDVEDKLLIASGMFPQILAFDVATGKPAVQRWTGQTCSCMEVHRETNTLITGHAGGYVRMYRLPSLTIEPTYGGHRANIRSIALSPDQQSFITGDDSGYVRLWDVASRSDLGVLRDYSDLGFAVKSISFGERDFSVLLGRSIYDELVTHADHQLIDDIAR